MPESTCQVAVIGAGAAGLAACRELLRCGHTPTVFEQQSAPGGVWIYDPAPATDLLGPGSFSSMYASLRTNLPRDLMAFTDYTFDSKGGGNDDWPRFPHHSRVLEYLQRFAADHDLLPRIHFNKRVTNLAPVGERWQLTLDSGERHEFDAVMVCNGHYSVPRTPQLPGSAQFTGEFWHAHNYREPAPFTGRKVALWGAAASGADLSREIATVAAETWLLGDRFAALTGSVRDGVKFAGSPVAFTGPDSIETAMTTIEGIDTFVYCTGYQYHFDFISDELITVSDNRVSPLYHDLVHASHPQLAFIGINYLVVPFPLFGLQARWFARYLSGAFELPSEAARLQAISERHARFRETGLPDRNYHRLGDDQAAYMRMLADECGCEAPPDWFHQLASAAQTARLANPAGFRDEPIPVHGPTRVPPGS